MHPTDAEPIDPKNIHIVASFPDVEAATKAARKAAFNAERGRWPLGTNRGVEERIIPSDKASIEERAAEEAAKYEDTPFKDLNIRQQYAYINSVKSQDARREKQEAEDAAEARLVAIEKDLAAVKEALIAFGTDTSEAFENVNENFRRIQEAFKK